MNNSKFYTNILKGISLTMLIFITFIGCKTKQRNVDNYLDQKYYKLENLIVSGGGMWKIDEQHISCSSGEGFIYTPESYEKVRLGAEFLADPKVNSGIFIGCKSEEINPSSCFEINIWDNHPNQSYRTGSIVTRQDPIEIVNTIDHWSTIEIIANEGWIQVWINDIKTADLKVGSLTLSPIYFQKFGEGSIKFRNIRITSLSK